ncbi:MAG TPA: hypothetical protein VF006_29710 [Longimicrobium sp.]
MLTIRSAALVAAFAALGVWQFSRGRAPEAAAVPVAEQVIHDEPHRLTREQAIREYQKCLRDMNSSSKGHDGRPWRARHIRNGCEYWRRMAYPRARHSGNRPLPPPRP